MKHIARSHLPARPDLPDGRRRPTRLTWLLSTALLTVAGIGQAQDILPKPDPAFSGRIGRTLSESTGVPRQPVQAPAGAPNVLLVLLDDVGFGATSTFGGPIPTPNLDRLATQGLRYNQFHTTALCSPTRAALLTGRNHHVAHSGTVVEVANGLDFPGYDTAIPRSTATIAEILKDNGYATAAFGKWHNTPAREITPAGPFDRWPTGLGFQYFYGFNAGATSQYHPALYQNTTRLPTPQDPDYHLTEDLAGQAIHWIKTQRSVAPERPFFAYIAPGATHSPHHVPKGWAERFRGQFDQGWDRLREETFTRQKAAGIIPANAQLTSRPQSLPAWDDIPAEKRQLYSRFAENYAGFLAHTDAQIGRVIDAIDQLGQRDNTLVIFIAGDNGASAEGQLEGTVNEYGLYNGSPTTYEQNAAKADHLGDDQTYSNYPVEWAWAFDTPFQYTKAVASHFGGTTNGVVISWPARIKTQGEVRGQFAHVDDVAPTILEATGIQAPTIVNGAEQQPFDGTSLVYSFDDANAKTRHTTQYFEMIGNRAIYQDGWIASSLQHLPWNLTSGVNKVEDLPWELYHIDEDYSQSSDLARDNPQKLAALRDLWWIEAARNQVLPLQDGSNSLFQAGAAKPRTWRYDEFPLSLPARGAPTVGGRSFNLEASLHDVSSATQGVLFASGGRYGGYAFLVQDGKPKFIWNFLDRKRFVIAAETSLPSGSAKVRFEFHRDPQGGAYAGGTGRILVDGQPVAEGRIEQTQPLDLIADETVDLGRDTGTPVDEGYRVPFAFTGGIDLLTLEVLP